MVSACAVLLPIANRLTKSHGERSWLLQIDLCLSVVLLGLLVWRVGLGGSRQHVWLLPSALEMGSGKWGRESNLLAVLRQPSCLTWWPSPLHAAQQELPVVSGTFPELQGSRQSCHCARTVEKAPRQVPGAQDVQWRWVWLVPACGSPSLLHTVRFSSSHAGPALHPELPTPTQW